MPIKCITFDLDDTLWDCVPALIRAEALFYDWLRAHCPRIASQYTQEALTAQRREFMMEHPKLHHDISALRRQWLGELIQTFDYASDLVEVGFRVYWEGRNDVRLYDVARATLEQLSQRYRLGAITNGNADVGYIGIGHYFDFVVTAAEAGTSKPDPAIFFAAVERAGVPAEQIVHVGDNPETDVAGARGVGMRAVWVNADRQAWPGAGAPDGTIRDVSELASILDGWHGTE